MDIVLKFLSFYFHLSFLSKIVTSKPIQPLRTHKGLSVLGMDIFIIIASFWKKIEKEWYREFIQNYTVNIFTPFKGFPFMVLGLQWVKILFLNPITYSKNSGLNWSNSILSNFYKLSSFTNGLTRVIHSLSLKKEVRSLLILFLDSIYKFKKINYYKTCKYNSYSFYKFSI